MCFYGKSAPCCSLRAGAFPRAGWIRSRWLRHRPQPRGSAPEPGGEQGFGAKIPLAQRVPTYPQVAARNHEKNGAWITQHGSRAKRKPPRVPRTPLCGTEPGGRSAETHRVPQWWHGVGGDFCLHEGLEKPPPSPRGPRLPPVPGQTSSSRNPPAHGWRFSSSPWGWPQSAPRPRAFNLPVQHKQGPGALTQGPGRARQGTRGRGEHGGGRPQP